LEVPGQSELKKEKLLMPQKLIAYWNSLPAWSKATVKTCAVAFVGAASTIIHHAYIADRGCITEHCILEYAAAGVHGGVLAVGAYLLKSPLGQKIVAQIPQGEKIQ
jgi:hypothetical protein